MTTTHFLFKQLMHINRPRHIDEFHEFHWICLVQQIKTSQQAQDRREKIEALSLAKECYSMKLDLLTNATVVDDAIRYVKSNQHQRLQSEKDEDQTHDHHDEDDYEDHDEDISVIHRSDIT